MSMPATSEWVVGNGWRSLMHRIAGWSSKVRSLALVLIWIWVALKSALGDEGGSSEALLSGPLWAAGVLCLAVLLMLRDSDPQRVSDDVVARPIKGFRRRQGSRIVVDRRRNGLPTVRPDTSSIRPAVVRSDIEGKSTRAAKIIGSGGQYDASGSRRSRMVA